MPAPGLDPVAVEALWPRGARLQLNHGSFGGVPVPVLEHWQQLQRQEEGNPHQWYREVDARVAAVTAELAGWLGGDPGRCALVANASSGMTLVLSALAAKARRVVLTDHGYGAVDRAVARTGLPVVRVHLDLDGDLTELLSDVVRSGDLVVLDHITSPTALVLPVRAVAELCRERGAWLVVDGAHAPGQLDRPLADLGATAWVGNLHKWPCAPRGTALVQVGEELADLLPATASWQEEQALPVRFGFQGTQQYAHWLAAPTAVRLLEEAFGWAALRTACSSLATEGQHLVCDRLGVAPPDLSAPAPFLRLVPLRDGPRDHAEAAVLRDRVAAEHGIEVAVTAWAGQGFVRLSAFAYNDLEDYARLADALLA